MWASFRRRVLIAVHSIVDDYPDRWPKSPPDGKVDEPPDEDPRPPEELLGRYRQGQLGQPGQQRLERDLTLQPGQRRAETEVDTVPERQMRTLATIDVEPLGCGEPAFVAVGRRQ